MAVAKETRRFGMAPKLLMDVIRRQAGTLAKAVMEGVMNSVDAKATKCQILLDSTSLSISDNGSGIESKDQIEKWFETFGSEHTAAEGKVYGTFRMGRGQLFAYGENKWRTGPFQMLIDVNRLGLDYRLESNLSKLKGCQIKIGLYEELSPSDLAQTLTLLHKWLKYAPIPIELNGQNITVDPKADKWTLDTEEAYIKTAEIGTLAIYNLGIHVMDLPAHRYGIGGTVVSKKQLKVNFARNDIQSDCVVWKEIRKSVETVSRKHLEKKASLNDDERRRLSYLVATGEPPANARHLKLFTAVTGRHYSALDIAVNAISYGGTISFCDKGDRIGDKIFQSKLSFVLAKENLERFNKTEREIVELVRRLADSAYLKVEHTPFDTLAGEFSESYTILLDKDLTVTERIWRDLAVRICRTLAYSKGRIGCKVGDYRRVVIGESDLAYGWTDGSNYIAVGREYLKGMRLDLYGITQLSMLLAHELCHEGPDTDSHTHTQEFYELYHELTFEGLDSCITQGITDLAKVIKANGRKLTKAYMKNDDTAFKVRKEIMHLQKQTLPKAKPTARKLVKV